MCQLLQVARAVRPDTVDRLADLAGALTDMLRDVAAARRSEPSTPGAPAGSGQAGAHGSAHPSHAADVEDIVVGTGDDPDDALDLDGAHDPCPEESRP
ncbi:MAG: hypothetical protein M3Y71_07710 [Actinomycetota bacterium]|nr:hypothetical protein [Actinomycetota bacterium]